MAGADYGDRIWRNGEPDDLAWTLGKGEIRIVPHKCEAYLVRFDTDADVTIDEVDLAPYKHPRRPEWRGEVEGYQFVIIQYLEDGYGDCRVDCELIEPDGTKWEGTSGYHYPPEDY